MAGTRATRRRDVREMIGTGKLGILAYHLPVDLRKVCKMHKLPPPDALRLRLHCIACLACLPYNMSPASTPLPPLQDEAGDWHALWQTDNFLARGQESIAEVLPTFWIGVITSQCFSRHYPTDKGVHVWRNLTAADEEGIKEALSALGAIQPIFLDPKLLHDHELCVTHTRPPSHTSAHMPPPNAVPHTPPPPPPPGTTRLSCGRRCTMWWRRGTRRALMWSRMWQPRHVPTRW